MTMDKAKKSEIFILKLRKCHTVDAGNNELDYFRSIIAAVNEAKRQNSFIAEEENAGQISEIADHLLRTLSIFNESMNTDKRLLCSTALCYILSMHQKIVNNINVMQVLKEKNDRIVKLCLVYGMIQSNFIKSDILKNGDIGDIIFFLIEYCMEYTEVTQMSFKVLYMLLQKITEFSFDLNGLIYVTITNWESPVTGVREYNCKLFGVLLGLMDSMTYDAVINDLNEMDWNKAKYLMIAEILNANRKYAIDETLANGVMNSLIKPGLMSSGTAVYTAVLKSVDENKWNELFLKNIRDFVLCENMYSVRNLCNYWLKATIQRFANACQIDDLLPHVNVVYVCVSRVKWVKASTGDTETRALLQRGLTHCNEDLRTETFRVLCDSIEIDAFTVDAFTDYLEYNVNSDCTSLRQSLLRGVAIFLSKIKQNNDLKTWLSKFIVKQLECNGNYQRDITTLSILEEALKYFDFGVQESFLSVIKSKLCSPHPDIREKASKILSSHKWNVDSMILPSESAHVLYTQCVQIQNEQRNDFFMVAVKSQKIYDDKLLSVAKVLKEQNDPKFLIDLLHFVDSESIRFNMSLFAKSQNQDGAASFAEMAECIDAIVMTSEQAPDIKDKEVYQKIVLHSIWKNIQAGCEVCSAIISSAIFLKLPLTDIIDKSLSTLIFALRNCLHKGVIEAAAAALGRSIKDLTLSETHIGLAKETLEKFLQKELGECLKVKEGNVRRRSAGLALCVGAFVANDKTKSKELFHFTMKYLTVSLKQERGQTMEETNDDVTRTSTLLHLSCSTVRDSNLKIQVMEYAERLLSLCFYFLKSKHWQVRNGALQLFGTLVPTLTGQKRASEEDCVSMSPEELFSHFPKAWNEIIAIISNSTDERLYHDDLVPILSFLATLAKRYSLDRLSWRDTRVSYDELFEPLTALLGSRNYTVRRLSATILRKFYDFNKINNYVNNTNAHNLKENHLHGILLLIRGCCGLKAARIMREADNPRRSYIVKCLRLEIEQCEFETVVNLTAQPHAFYLKESILMSQIQKDSHEEFVESLPTYLSHIEQINILPLISNKIIVMDAVYKLKCLEIIFKYLKTASSRKFIKDYYEVLFRIIKRTTLPLDDMNKYESYLFVMLQKNNGNSYNHGYLLPLIMILAQGNQNEERQQFLSNLVWELSQPDHYDEYQRYIAAVSLKYTGSSLRKSAKKFKENVLCSAILLLQDEDVRVRAVAAEFYAKCTNRESLNPSICLARILSEIFFKDLFCDVSCSDIIETLENIKKAVTTTKKERNVSENPFSNETSNVYWEPQFLEDRLGTIRDYFSLEAS